MKRSVIRAKVIKILGEKEILAELANPESDKVRKVRLHLDSSSGHTEIHTELQEKKVIFASNCKLFSVPPVDSDIMINVDSIPRTDDNVGIPLVAGPWSPHRLDIGQQPDHRHHNGMPIRLSPAKSMRNGMFHRR